MNNQLASFTAAQLLRAASIKEKIDRLNQELSLILTESSTIPVKATKHGGMSAAGRARVAAAQKARWAKVKKNKPDAKLETTQKRKMSAAGRARIAAAQKARWAKIKAKKA